MSGQKSDVGEDPLFLIHFKGLDSSLIQLQKSLSKSQSKLDGGRVDEGSRVVGGERVVTRGGGNAEPT